ncbi:MAG: FAD-dependent oxidoreductase [Gemmatimonadetes bacterium]|nr:FAD-dependent oxidoreductase [Gemmatimonadota bacterium]
MAGRYDVVIIGGGVHGLATAYYLAKRGVRNIAVLEKSYIGSGASGRNTAIIRSNYRTPEGVAFYDESLKLFEGLSADLGFNVLFSQQGHLTLAHSEPAINVLRLRADVNQVMGVDSRLIWPNEIKRLVPAMDTSSHPRYPILAALYHPPGGLIRHDAVVWGYARGSDRLGVAIHPLTEVVGIARSNGRVTGVRTNHGDIQAGVIVNATAGFCARLSRLLDLKLPVVIHPLQAFVTEPVVHFLDKVIVSQNLHAYVSQTDRGELVIGAEIDPYVSYSYQSTLRFLESTAGHILDLFPCLRDVSLLRQWTGICDVTPDYSPIMGTVPGVEGLVLDVGWGTYGFKAGPVSGNRIAELIATGTTPDLIKPYSIKRFWDDRLINEKASAGPASGSGH